MSRRIVLSSAARTATVSCPLVRNTSHRHLRAYLDVQGASGTGGLTLVVRGYSWNGVTATNGEAMGDPATLLTAPAAVTGTGVFVYELGPYPQAASGNVQLTVARLLPTYWDIQVQAADGSSYTYSVSVDLH